MTLTIPIILNRINSWTWLPLNSLKPIWLYWNPQPEEPPWNSATPFLTASTGDQKVSWTLSRTKDLAVHAGLSLPLAPLSPCSPSSTETSPTSLNNNWLIAQRVTETKDATEVWWPLVSPTSEIMVLRTKVITNTPEETVHARLRTTATESPDMSKFLTVEL